MFLALTFTLEKRVICKWWLLDLDLLEICIMWRAICFPIKCIKFSFPRDDALLLWSALKTFVKDIITLYYKSDDDVTKDVELQAWIKDLHDNGLPVREGDEDHEVPSALQTRDQLIDLLTSVVFTCSCQHAAVNFGLLDVSGFIPFTPSVMRKPPPTKKNQTSLKTILDTLPSKSESLKQVALLYVLTRYAEDEVSFKQELPHEF